MGDGSHTGIPPDSSIVRHLAGSVDFFFFLLFFLLIFSSFP